MSFSFKYNDKKYTLENFKKLNNQYICELEPNIEVLAKKYPKMKIIGNDKIFEFMKQFHNIDDLVDIHKRCFDLIDESAAKHNIKVYKGMEVDFFQSKEWRNDFETILKKLNPDYVIGATHFLKSKNNDFLCNLYVLDQYPPIPEENMNELLQNYWKNVVECINSGYFKFVVHPDYCTQYGLSVTPEWDECKYKVIEALHRTKTACEINTKSIRRRGYPSPDWWIVKELIKKEVPLLISDDAHRFEDVGAKFAEVEEKLSELGCKNRFVSL